MSEELIGIVRCGIGNCGSVANMIKKVGCRTKWLSSPEDFEGVTKIVFPGVGSFDRGVEALKDKNLFEALNKYVLEERIPVLGICLGMQILLEESEEGELKGFGWIKGKVVSFDKTKINNMVIPNMGWRRVRGENNDPLNINEIDNGRYYFVHSYHAQCEEEYIIGRSGYGYEFTCAIRKGHIMGVQFHPEKSLRYGMKVLETFCKKESWS